MGPARDGLRRRETRARHLVAPPAHTRVLLATAYDWAATYRTIRMLAQAGLTVEVICDPAFLLTRSRAVTRVHATTALRLPDDLAALLERERFDWIIPADDTIFDLLARLENPWWVRPWLPVPPGGRVAAFLTSKVEFAERCRELGLPVPEFVRVRSADEAATAAARFGFPAIGKAERGFGGSAVRRLDDVAAARAWYATVPGPAIVQRFVRGIYATTEMLYRRGALRAYVTSVRREYWPTPLSASCSREIIDLPEMRAIVEALGRYTGFDGLCGIDFIIDENGAPLLSELNPRPTPGHGMRRDVTAMFADAVRERFAEPAGNAIATITHSSGPMHHFPESLAYAATEGTIDSLFGAIESLRRIPVDEPRLAWAYARRAIADGIGERTRRKKVARRP